MNLNKPFRTYLFSWSLAWFMILFGAAILFIPERFSSNLLIQLQPNSQLYGLLLVILGIIIYVLLLLQSNEITKKIRNLLHVVVGVVFIAIGSQLLLINSMINMGGISFLTIALISMGLPFLKSRQNESKYYDLSIINLALLAFTLGLVLMFLPLEYINLELIDVNLTYVKLFGLTTLLTTFLLIASQIMRMPKQTKFLIHLISVLAISIIVLPSWLSPTLDSLEFVSIFLFTSSLTLFWDPKAIRGSFDSMQIQLLGVLIAVAFVLLFFFIVITGNYHLEPFTLTVYAFGTTFVASVVTAIVAHPLLLLQKGTKQLSKKISFVPIQIQGPAEIKQLTRKFNQMAQEIQTSQEHLENEVRERTQELTQSKNSLIQLLSRLKAVLQSTEEPLIAINQKGKIIIFNNAASQLTGHKPQNAIGQSPTKFLHLMDHEMRPLPESQSPLYKAFRTMKTVTADFEKHYYVKDVEGKQIPVTVTCSPVLGPYKQTVGIVCVIRNISVEKKLRELQNEFVFVAAHELRNPVTAIAGYLELALESKPRSARIKTALKAIEAANLRLRRLINDLLQVARSDTEQLHPKFEEIEIGDVINRVLKEQEGRSKEKGLVVKKIGLKAIDKYKVRADANFIHEVLTNLLVNAIKYTEEKKKIEVKIQTSPYLDKLPSKMQKKRKPKYVVIEVKDNGIGVPKEEQKNMFNKFFRASNAIQEEGSGLGMFIVRQLVHKMKGQIWFVSSEGKGSKFSFSLPLAN